MKRSKKRRRLTEQEWMTFKAGVAINNMELVERVSQYAKRWNKNPADEWETTMRAWLTSQYHALPPKKRMR